MLVGDTPHEPMIPAMATWCPGSPKLIFAGMMSYRHGLKELGKNVDVTNLQPETPSTVRISSEITSSPSRITLDTSNACTYTSCSLSF